LKRLGAAIALARLVESLVADLLLGLTATDAANLLTALVIMVGSAVTACLLPAFRATRIDPLQALRHE
jgi:putative ABC transport system permease protein